MCYIEGMGRPLEENKFLIQTRNETIHELNRQGFKQSDIAKIFRLPRNTVSVVLKTKLKEQTIFYGEYQHRTDIVQQRISQTLRRRVLRVLNSDSRAGSAVRDLGCTVDKLKKHIEEQFNNGMTWENWSQVGWHIDHIKPLALFDLTDRKQFLEACHYTNLQPLWATDNCSKGKKLDWVKRV